MISIKFLDATLATLVGQTGGIGFDYPTEKIWNPNGISLIKRLKKDPSLAKRIDKVLTPAQFKKYIVKADQAAPTRCIDGRRIKGWGDNVTIQNRPLGPKIAGATPHAALTHRIVETDNILDVVNRGLIFDKDIKSVIAQYKAAGFGFGGHIDDHAKGWNTGCGAVDNINKILEVAQLPEPQQQLRGLTRIILGDAYNIPIVNEVIGRILLLDAIKPKYMPKQNNDPEGEFIYKKTVVKTIRAAAKEHDEPVEQLEGGHNEIALVLNFARGTTIDTDRLSFDTKDEIQVFGWDMWEIFNEAHRLFPYSIADTLEKQRTAIENRLRHITVRTLLGVATAMVLTDGSLRIGIVSG